MRRFAALEHASAASETAAKAAPRLVTAEQALAVRHDPPEIERQRGAAARQLADDDRTALAAISTANAWSSSTTT